MSALSWRNASEPWPIPPLWGDAENFEWIPEAQNYWCKLCRKYSDDSHVRSRTHERRQQDPNTYLWYLRENRQLAGKCISTAAPPPSRGYELGVPAPPAEPPPSPKTATFQQDEKQQSDESGELLPSPHRNETKTGSRSDPIETTSHATYMSAYADCTPRHSRWHRYAVDTTRTAHWWWNAEHYELCFCEDTPGAWCRYSDPETKKEYWFLSKKHWFWKDTGTMMR